MRPPRWASRCDRSSSRETRSDPPTCWRATASRAGGGTSRSGIGARGCRGRSLGFPTANVLPEPQLIPGEGVYAGRAEIDDQPFAAAISIGRNPTFDGSDVSIEAHLLDFDGQPGDQPIRLEFIEWIREQRKFDSPQSLRRQIERDVARTRKRCATYMP